MYSHGGRPLGEKEKRTNEEKEAMEKVTSIRSKYLAQYLNLAGVTMNMGSSFESVCGNVEINPLDLPEHEEDLTITQLQKLTKGCAIELEKYPIERVTWVMNYLAAANEAAESQRKTIMQTEPQVFDRP